MTVTLKGAPEDALAGAPTASELAAAGLMAIPVSLPLMDPLAVSVAVRDWVAAVFRVALKVYTPASPALKL